MTEKFKYEFPFKKTMKIRKIKIKLNLNNKLISSDIDRCINQQYGGDNRWIL